MKRNNKIVSSLLSFLAIGLSFLSVHNFKNSEIAFADGSTNVTATNLKIDVNKATKGIYIENDIIRGLYFTTDANDAPYNIDWTVEYGVAQNNNVSILKKDGTYIENATSGKQNNGIIVKMSATEHYLKFENWTVTNIPEIGDTVTIRGEFKLRSNNSYVYTIPETSFLITTEEQPIEIPDTVNKINPVSVSSPEYDDQKWHFQFLAKGVNEETMPFTNGTGNIDAYSYVATSNKNIYLDGEPIAKINKNSLRRRDTWMNKDALIYVCNTNDSDSQVSGGQNFNANVGQILTFDGIFVHNNPAAKVAIEFDKLSLLRVGDGNCDYISIDLKQYLITDLYDNYNPDIYKDEDIASVSSILSEAEAAITAEEDVGEIYQLYENYKTQLDAFEYDSEKADAFLANLKQAAIEEINNYPNFNLYFDDEKTQINNLIATYTAYIQNATKKSEIDGYVLAFKNAVDNIATDIEIMQDAILNQKTGYEQYLETYNRVSLNSLNLGKTTFHGMTDLRKNDLNTNGQPNNLNNTFIPVTGNEDGNVAFQFKYQTNAIPKEGANLMVVLRGKASYGYKFAIDTNSRGLYLEMLYSDSKNDWIGGPSNQFTNNTIYNVEIGAIDLINEVGLTYLYVKINGSVVLKTIQNSFDFCNNPRVALSSNDNWGKEVDGVFVANDYEGEAVITSLNDNLDDNSGRNLGVFKVDEDPHSDAKNTIYAKLKNNDLPVSGEFYPLSNKTVSLVRNDETTEIANPSLPFLKKINDDTYSLDVKSIVSDSILDGDQIVVNGYFSAFDDDSGLKYSFAINKTTFTYNASSNSWSLFVTLEDAKNNAEIELNNYVDYSQYDEEEKQQIQSIIDAFLTQINNATSVEEVEQLLANALTQIDNVPTSFRKIQNAAIDEINQYKADELDLYRQDEKDEIARLKLEAIESVNNALTQEEINSIVINFKIKVDALKTNEQYEKEELDDAKLQASETIKNHYAKLIASGKYKDENLTLLNEATLKAIDDIEKATSIEEVNNIVSNYLSTYKLEEKEDAKNNFNPNGLIIGLSVGAGVLVLAGVGILLFIKLRKKK